jgi:hypothetical protein
MCMYIYVSWYVLRVTCNRHPTQPAGVRRIVGLTRQAAKSARRHAADILARLDGLQKLSGGAELSAGYKTLKMEVRECV